jgi:hypothetical protein
MDEADRPLFRVVVGDDKCRRLLLEKYCEPHDRRGLDRRADSGNKNALDYEPMTVHTLNLDHITNLHSSMVDRPRT